jgi:hypothetical protein
MKPPPQTYSEFIAKFRNDINSSNTNFRFDSTDCTFFSYDVLNQVASVKNIDTILQLDPDSVPEAQRTSFRKNIRQKGIRLFGIAMYSQTSMSSLQNIMASLSDYNLPLNNTQCPSSTFFDNQTRFLVPGFRTGRFDSIVGVGCTLPIKIRSISLGSGVAGNVSVAHIYPGQHDIPDLQVILNQQHESYLWSTQCACKIIRHDNHQKTRSAQRERKFLQFLANKSITHDHIAKFYTGFQHNNRTYLFSELVRWDLEVFMGEKPNGKDEQEEHNPQWLLDQMRGLADALRTIHDPVPGTNEIAYHHDIKPPNILAYPISPGNCRFKLTDWGCAGIKVSGSTDIPGSISKGNPPYLPPETDKSQPTSLPHDVWSLGCVFLELLIWFTHGRKHLETFRVVREHDAGGMDSFYIGQSRVDTVNSELDKMAKAQGRMWAPVVKVLRGMLEIQPHEPQRRSTANEVKQQLDAVRVG